MNQDSSFLDACTASLADDPELRLEVETELAGHLEDAASDCNGDRNEAELRFGAPEELSQSLWLANRRRFSRRARIRFWIKWLTVPVLLGALYFGINLRQLAALHLWRGTTRILPPSWLSRTVRSYMPQPDRTPDQQLIYTGAAEFSLPGRYHPEHLAMLRTTWEKLREPEFLAIYLTALCRREFLSPERITPATRDFLLREIAIGEELEPDNALYPYLAAAVWLKQAVKLDLKTRRIADRPIKDEAAFRQAREKFRNGLEKPFYRGYMREYRKKVLAAAHFPDDVCGRIENEAVTMALPRGRDDFLPAFGGLMLLAADRANTGGNAKEAAFWYNAWKTLVRQWVGDTDDQEEILALSGIAQLQYDAAQKRGDERRMGEAKNAAGVGHCEWRQRLITQDDTLLHGGIFTIRSRLYWDKPVPEAALAPDRNISYWLNDSYFLTQMYALWCGILILTLPLALIWCRVKHRMPALLLMSWRRYRTILVWGLLLPLAVYLLWTQSGWLGNRKTIWNGSIPASIDALLPLVLMPLWLLGVYMYQLRRWCRITGTMSLLHFGNRLLNLIPALAFFLLSVGIVTGPLLRYRIEHEKERDTLFFNTENLTVPEQETTQRLRQALTQALPPGD